MRSLNQFAGYRQVFKDAQILPAFFQTNLVDPSRVVKFFQKDAQGQIRIFYYQYLKLCFELQNVDYDMYIRKIEEIINNVDFQFIFYPEDDGSIYNDTQAKSFIMQFFGILGEGNNNVLQSLTKYPIMDKILVHFFRSILILSNITNELDSYVQREKLLNFLCQTFDVQANIYGQCIRYADTDIFVYQLNQNAIYMAYMDYDNYNNSAEQSPQVIHSQQPNYQASNISVPNLVYNPVGNVANRPESNRKEALAKDSYIADDFIDFTSNAGTLSSKAKQVAKQVKIDVPVKARIQVEKPVPKSQIIPTLTSPKQAPKQLISQIRQDYSGNVNSSVVEVKSIPSQASSLIRPQVKLDYWQSSSNPLQLAYTTQTIQSQSSSKYSSNNLQSYEQFPKLGQGPAQTKEDIINQIQKQTYQPPIQQQILPQQPPKQQFPSSQQQYLAIATKPIKNDLIYNPKLQNPVFNIATYLPTKLQQNPKDLKSVTSYNTGSKDIKSRLNVSQQYSSSQITKYMVQPHRTNVQNIKARQRNVRSPIMNQIK